MSTSGGKPTLESGSVVQVVSPGTITSTSASEAAAANVAAVATLAAVAAKLNVVTFVLLTAGSAAASVDLTCTIIGLVGGTWTFVLSPGTANGAVIAVPLNPGVPSAAVDTAIVATIPASGAAGPAIAVQLVGYTQ